MATLPPNEDTAVLSRITELLDRMNGGTANTYEELVATLRAVFVARCAARRGAQKQYFPLSQLRDTCRRCANAPNIPPGQLMALHLASADALLSAMALHFSPEASRMARSLMKMLADFDDTGPRKALLLRLHFVAGLTWDEIVQLPGAEVRIGDPAQIATELAQDLKAAGLSQEALQKQNLRPRGEITHLLADVRDGGRRLGDIVANDEKKLRREAAYLLSREQRSISLQATDLVNEMFLRLPKDAAKAPVNHLELDSLVKLLMRHILVDRSRKRIPGQSKNRADLPENLEDSSVPIENSLLVEEVLKATKDVLQELRETDPDSADLVGAFLLRSADQNDLATLHSMSRSTVKRRIKDGRDRIRQRLGLE